LQVHVGASPDQCITNNNARLRRQEREKRAGGNAVDPVTQLQQSSQEGLEIGKATDEEDPYPSELLNNLIFRYEEPSVHSRWDKPLFTVPWSDPSPPVNEIWTAITGIPVPKPTPLTSPISSLLTSSTSLATTSESSPLKPSPDAASTPSAAPTVRTTFPRPKIKPHQATVQPAATDPITLYAFEKKTSSVVTAIRGFTLSHPSAEAALARGNDSQGITIPVPEASTPIFIPAHAVIAGATDELAGAGGILALPRLQRLRRQWIGLNRAYVGQNQGQGKGSLSIDQVGDAFVRYLNAEFAGEAEQE
jgi:protein KTI12